MEYRFKKYINAYKPVLNLLLFSMYAVCLIVTIIFGAKVYNSIVENKEESFNKTVALSYITTKVRGCNDEENTVKVEELDGKDALVISEEFDGEKFETWLYIKDGFLCELFTSAETEINPMAGTDIIPLEKLKVSIKGKKLNIFATDSKGESVNSSVNLIATPIA